MWTLFREGGEAVKVTDTASGVDDYAWSPDGKRMVLVVEDPTPVELESQRARRSPRTRRRG